MVNMTEVRLISVPLEKDYAHTLYFETIAEQESYFAEQTVHVLTDFSYQRKDNVLRVPVHIDILYRDGINYVSYQNKAYSNKRFYAFVTDMKYVNDERTDVFIQTDCIQTWMFDMEIKPCFVEREHVAYDGYGEHTIDEGLEFGDYKAVESRSITIGDEKVIVAAVSKTPDEKTSVGRMYHGIYSGLAYVAFAETGGKFEEFVASYDKDAAADAISMVFLAPASLVMDADGNVQNGGVVPESTKPRTVVINKVDAAHKGDVEIIHEFSTRDLDGHEPRNKKLLCYPYRYLLVSNNAGGSAMYKFEKFGLGTTAIYEPAFTIYGCLTPGCSIRLIPMEYNGSRMNHEEGLNMGKYPTLNWTSDAFTNWLTQNSVNIGLDLATGGMQVVGGLAGAVMTGGIGGVVGAGQVMSGLTSIAGTMAQVHQQSLTPPQARGNTNSGDVITATGDNEFKFYTMSIKKEYAMMLDEFFDMYGYKCHRVKVPEKNHRTNYWYTKTIDANITGPIPQADLQTIKDCYNRGITFWKTQGNFRNYNVSNETLPWEGV